MKVLVTAKSHWALAPISKTEVAIRAIIAEGLVMSQKEIR